MPNTILFLNENPLPGLFTKGTIAGKELRLRSALPSVTTIHVLSPVGVSVTTKKKGRGPLEKKIVIHPLWPCPYYLRTLPLTIQGFFLALRVKPMLIEAESPIISGPAAVIVGVLTRHKTVIEMRASYFELIKLHARALPYQLKKTLLRLVLHFSLSHATAVIANSKTYQKILRQSFAVSSTVINPGLQYLPKKRPVTQHSSITIGFLGRLVPEKGARILLNAVRILKKQRLPAYAVEIAGAGPEAPALHRLTSKYTLPITFLGVVDGYQALGRWQVMVNPCIVNHPLEMANAEAAAMGVPVICFGTPEIPETVIHNRTGLKVTSPTGVALAQALKTLLTNPRLRSRLAKNGPAFARNHYRFTTQVGTLKKLYQRLGVLS